MSKVDNPAGADFDRSTLGDNEKARLDKFYNRGLRDLHSERTGVLAHMFESYSDEIRVAAEGARAQFDKRFDGQEPRSGYFGIDTIQAGYFGYDSWDNFGTAAQGVNTWLDNAEPDNLGGAGGQENPLRVGDGAFHVITGIGTYAESPVTTAYLGRYNDHPRTRVSTEHNFRNTDLRVKWLDAPIILSDDDDVYAEIYADQEGEAVPYLIGVSFLEAKNYRRLDPANMVGNDRIVSE